eukprot:9263215-Pyramimonas_sp.AAC.1
MMHDRVFRLDDLVVQHRYPPAQCLICSAVKCNPDVWFVPHAPVWGDQFVDCSAVARGRNTAVKVTCCACQKPEKDVQNRAIRGGGSGFVVLACWWGGRFGVYDHLCGRCRGCLCHLSRG